MGDLGERLEARSQAFDLPRGALLRTLARAERQRLRRRIAAGLAAAVIGIGGTAVVVSAFGGGGGEPPVDRSSPAVSTIPAGVYWTPPLTRDQIMTTMTDAGFSRREAQRSYFDQLSISFEGTIRMGLVIQEGFWFQTARGDTGEQEAGWSGSFRVTGPHTVQASGYGCTITYRFSLKDDSLILDVVRETGKSPECGSGDLIPQTAIFESAPFAREE